MNGKLARAIRRAERRKATPLDIERLTRRQAHQSAVAALGPKPIKQRVRKYQHHPLRDKFGAYTLTGRDFFDGRRKWVAGISARFNFGSHA